MGTWGPGNLDNDYAHCELADRSVDLINTMMERARRKKSREFDEYDYTTLFVELEIVFALDAKGLLKSYALPTPDEVEELKWDFVRDWETCYKEGNGRIDAARRRCILQTFNRFKRLCKKHLESPRG